MEVPESSLAEVARKVEVDWHPKRHVNGMYLRELVSNKKKADDFRSGIFEQPEYSLSQHTASFRGTVRPQTS